MNPSTPTPPTNPTDLFAILKWHQEMLDKGIKDARDDIKSQMKMYVTIFSAAFGIAGALITFGGSLGYREAVNSAVSKIQSTITEDIKTRIVTDAAGQIETMVPQVMVNTVRDDIVSRIRLTLDQRYIRLDGHYSVRNINSGRILDVTNAGQGQPYLAPVVATPDSRQVWTFVAGQ